MAWQLRVTEVKGTEIQMVGDPPQPVEVDITPSGRWAVHVEYFDSAAPAVVLHEHDFVFYSNEVNTAQALEQAQALGRKVRDTRALIASLQTAIGTAFNI